MAFPRWQITAPCDNLVDSTFDSGFSWEVLHSLCQCKKHQNRINQKPNQPSYHLERQTITWGVPPFLETFWCLAMAPTAVLLRTISPGRRVSGPDKKMHPLCVGMHVGPISIRKRKNAKKFGLWVSLDLSTAGEKNASSAILGYESWWIILDCRWSKKLSQTANTRHVCFLRTRGFQPSTPAKLLL